MTSDNTNKEPLKESRPNAQEGTRKLAAIMFTDIKDFSKKMQKNEAATMRMLNLHNEMMNDAVNRNGGSIIKTIGDAYLVSFDSVVSATLCAVEAQQAFYQHNTKVHSDDERIDVRIGVHLGDIIVKDKDVFGDGVNIASRIQSIAEVGGVNISDSVYQQVRNKISIRVLNLGVPQLKGIEQRIRVYQVIVVPTDKSRGKIASEIFVLRTILKRKKTRRFLGIGFVSTVVVVLAWIYLLAPAPPPNSLAILPFKNLGDPANEYIADGFSQYSEHVSLQTGRCSCPLRGQHARVQEYDFVGKRNREEARRPVSPDWKHRSGVESDHCTFPPHGSLTKFRLVEQRFQRIAR